MLTKKELLKYKKQKDKIIPSFLDPQDSGSIHDFCAALCELFAESLGKTRKQIEEEARDLMLAFDIDSTVSLGLIKLCMDSLTFESLLSEKTTEFRTAIFHIANAQRVLLAENRDVNIYKEAVISALTNHESQIHQNIGLQNNILSKEKVESYLYSDLPEFHKVTEIKPFLSPLQLLNKYNVSLVQGLLFYCSQIKLTLPSIANYKAQFRQLIKQIKFFQLVAYFKKQDDIVTIEIDGPLSLFVHTQKYGFNLACFFPALLLMPQWEIEASIEMGKEPRKCGVLKLSHKINLISHYKNYSAYIPEEFKLFAESFNKQECKWNLNENCDDILFDNDNYFFPDFEFIHEKGKRVYLELFHPWHSTAIKHRLSAFAKKAPSFHLLVGVSKTLLKDPDFSSEVQKSEHFNQFSFTFRDVISSAKVLNLLKNFE